ncbi:MAG: polymer-forming cytoskeletal protein [Alphaproteobacteria bacterium]
MFSKDKSNSGARAKQAAPTIISSDIKVRGDLKSDGEIQVDGLVEGDVACRSLSVGASGVITGAVSTEQALVRGQINGEIRSGVVTLTKSARVKGDVLHETLTIEPGAQLEGHCRRLNSVADENGNINLVMSDGIPTRPST